MIPVLQPLTAEDAARKSKVLLCMCHSLCKAKQQDQEKVRQLKQVTMALLKEEVK